MSAKKKQKDEPTYAALSGELDTILDEIESGEIDLDALSDKVERAATLLGLCPVSYTHLTLPTILLV